MRKKLEMYGLDDCNFVICIPLLQRLIPRVYTLDTMRDNANDGAAKNSFRARSADFIMRKKTSFSTRS